MKKLALSPAFNHDSRSSLKQSLLGKNAMKTKLSRHLMNETWYKSQEGGSLYMVMQNEFLSATFKAKINQSNLQQPSIATLLKIWSTASLELKI